MRLNDDTRARLRHFWSGAFSTGRALTHSSRRIPGADQRDGHETRPAPCFPSYPFSNKPQ